MGTFMAAYLAVWLAVVLYVGRMGMRQRLLLRTLDALEDRIPNDAFAPIRTPKPPSALSKLNF